MPFTPSNSGQRSPPTYYRGCWHVVSRGFLQRYRHSSSLWTEVYDSKAFFLHAALLHQAFAHCAIFPTAASRRSLDRVSVPVWPVTLSGRLPVVALVSRYLTNQLIGHEYLLSRISAFNLSDYGVLGSVSERYPPRQDSSSCFTHPSATPYTTPCYHFMAPSFNLHVLRTPPAFILSQDQTLSKSLQDPSLISTASPYIK